MRSPLVLLPVLGAILVFGCADTAGVVPRGSGTPEPSLSLILPRPSGGFELLEPKYKTHDLTKLRVGMTKGEVRALFADPRDVRRTPKDEYWEYEWFELYFRDGRLVNWFDL